LRARAQLTDPVEDLAYVAEWREAFRGEPVPSVENRFADRLIGPGE